MTIPAEALVRMSLGSGYLTPFPPILDVETPEHEALWREGVRLASAAYHAARICWNCGERWNDAGECPKKGCRGPGSGFERVRVPPEGVCVSCGTLTRDWYMCGIAAAEGKADGETIPAEWLARCSTCEAVRNAAQLVGYPSTDAGHDAALLVGSDG